MPTQKTRQPKEYMSLLPLKTQLICVNILNEKCCFWGACLTECLAHLSSVLFQWHCKTKQKTLNANLYGTLNKIVRYKQVNPIVLK